MEQIGNADIEEIRMLVEDNQLSFLIGAGFSKNVSRFFPLWRELLTDAIWNAFGTGNELDRQQKEDSVCCSVLQNLGYLGIASKVVADAGYHEAIDAYIESHTPYLALEADGPVLKRDGDIITKEISSDCHILLGQLNAPNIYTFNYDNALEFFLGDKKEVEAHLIKLRNNKADKQKELTEYKELIARVKSSMASLYGKDPLLGTGSFLNKREADLDKRVHDLILDLSEIEQQMDVLSKKMENAYLVVKQSSDIALTSGGHNIYKIHGDVRTSADLPYGFDGDRHTQYIITKEDYDTYETKHPAFVNLMRIDLLRNRFCIVGVSGNDANFLAWINWVKDVLDKTGREESGIHSFFIHSGNRDLSREMRQMLRNHFIHPVVLKELFPEASDDSARIKAFLQYIQPNNTCKTERLRDLWRKVNIFQTGGDKGVGLNNQEVNELCELAPKIVFHKADSFTYFTLSEILDPSLDFLKYRPDLSHKIILSAALRCSLLPILQKETLNSLDVLRRSRNRFVKESYYLAVRRFSLLATPMLLKEDLKGDRYEDLLRRCFLYDFPAAEECRYKCESGLDSVRQYSLQALVGGKGAVESLDVSIKDFSSPQELVLAADWLLSLRPSSKTPLATLAERIRNKYSTFSLSEYFHSYIEECVEDKYSLSFGNHIYKGFRIETAQNAAVVLNSIVELGITFAGVDILADSEWIAIASELMPYFPYPVVFYTIARCSSNSVILRVAQELVYSKSSYPLVPDLLKRMLHSLTANNTPDRLKVPIIEFARRLFVAVPVDKWEQDFVRIAEDNLGQVVTQRNRPNMRKIYAFVREGLKYVKDKEFRLRVLKHVMDVLRTSSKSPNSLWLNNLAIRAKRGLNPDDFAPLADDLFSIAEARGRSKVVRFVSMNLADLLPKQKQCQLLNCLGVSSARDSILVRPYFFLIQSSKKSVAALVKTLLMKTDIWYVDESSGMSNMVGGGVEISVLDEICRFSSEQVITVFNEMEHALNVIINDIQNNSAALLSGENPFGAEKYRSVIMDMRVFLHRHKNSLTEEKAVEFESKIEWAYSKCVFNKSILQLLADDNIQVAVQCMMNNAEMYGGQTLALEYEALLSVLMIRKSNMINACFDHIARSIIELKDLFNTPKFIALLFAVLDSYTQYFDESDQVRWDVLGCEKENAESYLLSISDALMGWGQPHRFWSTYNRRYYYIP